ncbi:hypothetical protein FA15DRAFT_483445 [Coprinopsis marcescibilis]|uniref:Uncharacterized protein n=1 Tax=Coprinopsis marcescibilis TaxID=230819 RepID=A0A5C3L731_COPMA|nr:hypothetical protein FA15DRAFT_483445 [Coprinopsis marcescibilis]
MPSLGILRNLLHPSSRSQAKRRKLQKAESSRSSGRHREQWEEHDSFAHADRGRDEGMDYGQYPEMQLLNHGHLEPMYLSPDASMHSPPYQAQIHPYAPVPTYPIQMHRYELYDRPVTATPYYTQATEPVPRVLSAAYGVEQGPPTPQIHPQPIRYNEPPESNNSGSWDLVIPDVRRQSTVIDPDEHYNYGNEVDHVRRQDSWQGPDRPDSVHGGPTDHTNHHSRHSKETGEDSAGRWRVRDSVRIHHERSQTHSTDHHRDDEGHPLFMKPHQQTGSSRRGDSGVLRSRDDSHSQRTRSSAEGKGLLGSIKKKLSQTFGTNDSSHSPAGDRDAERSLLNAQCRSRPSRSESPIHSRKESDARRRSHSRSSSKYTEDPADQSENEQYQYIVPPGVNVIFKDEDGNEITRYDRRRFLVV